MVSLFLNRPVYRNLVANLGIIISLHKEIVDFFDYIKPRDFEERLRAALVQDMKAFCRDAYRDADIHAFGSFPSGLYLPTGDMDLVMLSERFVNRGVAMYSTKKALFKFRDLLKAKQIPWQGDVELILHARVPLAKYIDRKTGLKVDVSFENSTGLNAIKTFLGWKEQYPGMPALVTLVKHFLLMRGLNEPVNGGIGGFSVICLVVSMLQMSPEVQSGALDTAHHLGELLMRFFDLYGNKFDYENLAIRLTPPGYIPKVSQTAFCLLCLVFALNFDRIECGILLIGTIIVSRSSIPTTRTMTYLAALATRP